MKVRCAWCGLDLGEKEPLVDTRYTHGICEPCNQTYEERSPAKLTLGEYLDRFEAPVIVVDEDARVLAVNRSMSDRLGSDARSLLGLQGGVAMECRSAAHNGGCGNELHCRACAIRRLVEESLRNHCSSGPTQAVLHCGDTDVVVVVSSQYFGGPGRAPLVVVRTEPIDETPVTESQC